jgi:hypothetical protein
VTSTETDTLDPQPRVVTLDGGMQLQVQPLRTRQFFALLRIITHGGGEMLARFPLDPSEGAAVFGPRLLMLLLLSIPDAVDETIAFVQSVTAPVGLIERGPRPLNRQDTERNNALLEQWEEQLDNPGLDDLVSIVEDVVGHEVDNLAALGKRLGAMIQMAIKTGQLARTSTTSPTVTSSADSPAPSTSSPASTDGPPTSAES